MKYTKLTGWRRKLEKVARSEERLKREEKGEEGEGEEAERCDILTGLVLRGREESDGNYKRVALHPHASYWSNEESLSLSLEINGNNDPFQKTEKEGHLRISSKFEACPHLTI